jgi:hypothetical protein
MGYHGGKLNAWDQYKSDSVVNSPESKPIFDWLEEQGTILKRHARSHSLAIAVGGIFLVFVVLFFVVVYRLGTPRTLTAGATGDFIAGTLGTLVGIVSVIALFITLKNDRLAKEEEGFEDKYYQLLKLHRSNVAEIRLGDSTGRRVFVLMIREFRCILVQLKDLSLQERFNLSRQELICASYFALFYGVGPNSSRMLIDGLKSVGFPRNVAESIERLLNTKELKRQVKEAKNFAYTPFEGHQSRLGHYFRHLYQMVTYIHSQNMKEFAPWLTDEEECERKRQYIKTIRAQLSTHEQALLLLNSLTPIGSVWWYDEIMVRYKLVKNVPIEFFDRIEEIDVEKHIAENDYFEDEEIRRSSAQPWRGWPLQPY